jgi:hypothetical protein
MKSPSGPLSPLIVALAVCAAGCGDQQQSPPPAAKASSSNAPATMFTNSSSGSPITAPVDYLGALGRGKETAVKTVDVARLTQAIQIFNVQEGRYPKDLNELVEKKYINQVPDAPYGLKLDYDPASGQVKVVKQ